MIKALAHVCMLSSDLAKTEWFYCNVLGMTRQFDFMKEGELYGYYLKMSNLSFVEVFKSDKIAEEAGKLKHMCLEVEDIDTLEHHLKEHGIECRAKKMGADNSWQLWCKDPDGVDIEFHQYTDKSSQVTGEACIVNW